MFHLGEACSLKHLPPKTPVDTGFTWSTYIYGLSEEFWLQSTHTSPDSGALESPDVHTYLKGR